MDWFGLTLQTLSAGLSLWKTSQSRKYLDEIVFLKNKYYEEIRKPIFEAGMPQDGDYRSDVVIEHLAQQLRVLCDAFVSATAGDSGKA